MRIHELITEAISVSSYDKPIELAIKKSVVGTLTKLTDLYGYYKKLESDFNDYNASDREFINAMTMEYHQELIISDLASDIKTTINQQIGNQVVAAVFFVKLEQGVKGSAPGRTINLSKEYLKDIAKLVIDTLITMTTDNFSQDEKSKRFFSLCEEAAAGNRFVVEHINQAIYETVYDLVDVIIHELTHVLQHYPQLIKGRSDTEYRSYLDRKKNQFVNTNKERADPESWRKLYLASPQEIAAFAHNAALYVIRSYGMHRATVPGDLYKMTSDDISDGVNRVLGKYFAKPKTAEEQRVRNRYLKLVYMEIHKYLKEKLASLQKTV